ncbi:hypothetical protein EVG20_g449 [Dentipellis fragilis]|uniref:U6 snRNA phosphodiesterase 1 n=1 Tax=Dentipellis fragilis TaxID=205917 RepID=A0A4Y9ZFK3_9AGAM|nr:hypothetical protein EVG20_g449 [Dentipellis fragilis]
MIWEVFCHMYVPERGSKRSKLKVCWKSRQQTGVPDLKFRTAVWLFDQTDLWKSRKDEGDRRRRWHCRERPRASHVQREADHVPDAEILVVLALVRLDLHLLRMKRTAIVSYSDSSESEAESSSKPPKSTSPPQKKRKLPPLAPQLTLPIPVDDPSKHQGRVRTTPHAEGQWAAYVYAQISLNDTENAKLKKAVRKAFDRAREKVPGLHSLCSTIAGKTEGLFEGPNEDLENLHVSLTRPFFLRAHQREEVKRAIRAVAKSHKQFIASFASFSELMNDERTRTFLCMEVGGGHNEFRELSDALTPTLRAFKQKEYYERPRFHASFAWALLEGSTPPIPSDPSDTPVAPSRDDLGALTPTSGLPRPLKRYTSSPAPSTAPVPKPASLPAIPSFPPDLVPDLNADFAKVLVSPTCAFEVRELKVRIGKDVFGWSLG